jgi:tetrahydrodipicolinate N-succinyltransferase
METERITAQKVYRELKKLESMLEKKGIIAEQEIESSMSETVLLSEKSLAKEWLNPEEDEAWKDL